MDTPEWQLNDWQSYTSLSQFSEFMAKIPPIFESNYTGLTVILCMQNHQEEIKYTHLPSNTQQVKMADLNMSYVMTSWSLAFIRFDNFSLTDAGNDLRIHVCIKFQHVLPQRTIFLKQRHLLVRVQPPVKRI